MNSNSDFQVRAAVSYKINQGDIVFFRIDVYEMFNINLDYPGIKSCLNKAYLGCRKYIPYDTGITYRSFTPKVINDHTMEYFFDPAKVIGQNRKGKVVSEYYVQYIAATPKNYSWLTKVIYDFYEIFFREVSKLKKAKEKIRQAEKGTTIIKAGQTPPALKQPEQEIKTKTASIFLETVRAEFKQKQDEAKRLQEIEKQQKRNRLIKRLKLGGSNNDTK